MKHYVLIVDDRTVIAKTLSAVLRAKDFDTEEAHSIQEAFNLLQVKRFDAVLCDMNIDSQGDGVKVIREAKRLMPNRPIIIMSGSDESIPEDMAGADAVIFKPMDPPELSDLIRRLILEKAA